MSTIIESISKNLLANCYDNFSNNFQLKWSSLIIAGSTLQQNQPKQQKLSFIIPIANNILQNMCLAFTTTLHEKKWQFTYFLMLFFTI